MASSQDAASVYEDLVSFLKADRADLREKATEAVQQVTDRDEMEKLIQHGIVAPLVRNCSDTDTKAGLFASQALVQLSSGGKLMNQCILDMIEAKALPRMVELVLGLSPSNEDFALRTNFALALLANMTRTEEGAIDMVGRTLPDRAVTQQELDAASGEETSSAGANADDATSSQSTSTSKSKPLAVPSEKPTLQLLLERFLNRACMEQADYRELAESDELETHGKDPYQHFAGVLMNLTQVEAGRRFLLRLPNKERGESMSVFETILGQLRSANPIRRRGVAGTVRNCCLEKESAWWFLHEVKVMSHILYPLAGPEELDVDEKIGMDPDLWLEGPDKERETDDTTRLFLVESVLLLLMTSRKSREMIRKARTYVILKYADMVEELEQVSDRVNECVQYLRRDEEGTAEGSSDKMVTNQFRRDAGETKEGDDGAGSPRLALPPSTTYSKASTEADVDYDGVD